MEEIGRLCAAWSHLEHETEVTLWGILGADDKLGPFITWRLDMRSRWQMILENAPKKHNEDDLKELRGINKDLTPAARDRNIIVHGLVHALLQLPPGGIPRGVPITNIEQHAMLRVPCWTVFRGAEAGKNFPVSTTAVEIVRTNLQKLGQRVTAFNIRHNYDQPPRTDPTIEKDWPKPLG